MIDPARAWPCSFRPQSVADPATTASPAPRHPPPRRTSRNRCCARAVVLVGRAAPAERARSGARPRLRPPVQRRGRVQGGSNSKIARRSLQNRRRTDFRGRAMNPSILDRCVPGGSNCRAATHCRIYCRLVPLPAPLGSARLTPPQPPRHRHPDLTRPLPSLTHSRSLPHQRSTRARQANRVLGVLLLHQPLSCPSRRFRIAVVAVDKDRGIAPSDSNQISRATSRWDPR